MKFKVKNIINFLLLKVYKCLWDPLHASISFVHGWKRWQLWTPPNVSSAAGNYYVMWLCIIYYHTTHRHFMSPPYCLAFMVRVNQYYYNVIEHSQWLCLLTIAINKLVLFPSVVYISDLTNCFHETVYHFKIVWRWCHYNYIGSILQRVIASGFLLI